MDVVNYSSKMGEDDEGTLKLLAERRSIIEQHIKIHGGRIFNSAGDAFMIDFSSPIEAVKSAIKIQKEIFILNKGLSKDKSLEFRIGINMGDVIIEGDNLFGDGVNIAARLESIAPPGRVCIPEAIYSMISADLQSEIIDRGFQKLKNIKTPIKVYFIETVDGSEVAKKHKINKGQNNSKNLFISLSAIGAVAATMFFFLFFNDSEIDLNLNTIVVLPINTISSDKSQISLAAGLTQDISTSLSRSSKKLNVIKLNNVPNDLEKIATKSEARFIITGDLRSAANSLRVSVNLIDAETMKIAWSENFDRKSDIANIFQLQDDIVSNVIDALVGSGAILSKEVVKAATVAGSKSMDAYACVNIARGFLISITPDGFFKSLKCLEKSVEEDPNYKEAWQYYGHILGWSYSIFKVNSIDILSAALNSTEEAIALDPSYAEAHATKAEIEFYYKNFEGMLKAGNRAIELAPNNANVLGRISYLFALSGWGCHSSKELKEKYEIDSRACYRLKRGHEIAVAADKLDPYKTVSFDNFGRAPLYQDSKDWESLLAVMEEQPQDFMWWHHYMGTASHHLGKKENAQKYFNRVIELLGGENTIEALKKEAAIWHEMTVIEEMMPVYLEYGLK
jgi:TolB-like protein